MSGSPTTAVAERLEAEDLARARWYSFFSRWFLAPPDQQAVDLFMAPSVGSGCSGVHGHPDVSPSAAAPVAQPGHPSWPDQPDRLPALASPEAGLDSAWSAFNRAVAAATLESMRADYDDTFISVGEAPVSLHASVYLTGFANERPLAEIRQWLAAQGIAATQSGLLTEDHLGLLCEVMAWLIIERADHGSEGGDAAQQFLFQQFLAPVCDEFCRRLASLPQGGVYRALGDLFAAFAAIERQAFDIER